MSGSVTAESREALELHEGISLLEAASSSFVTRPDGTRIELGYDMNGDAKAGGVFDAQGRVPLHVIRPGIGKGRGRHLYEAAMLSRDAGKFTGWKMYANHLSPEAKKAANGLPRDVRDLGGRVQESWWDASVPANPAAGHDAGGVMGMVRPVKFIRELIDDDPELVEASISAQATAVQPITRDGQRVWLVEGIRDRGSVDWVTEAGAGGRIAPLLQESYADDEDVQTALLESMSDDFLREHLKEHRPTFLQEAGTSVVEEAKDDKKGKDDEKVAELMKKGLPEAAARKAAAKSSEALTETIETPGGDVADITPEALAEALKANPTLIVEALTESGEGQVFITSLVEAKLEEERDTLRAESKADTDRAFELARMEREAHGLIRESKLPDTWQDALIEKFSIDEANAPAPALDVVAKVGEDGKVEKPAIEVLREAVTSEIDSERVKLREASTTRIRPAVALAETKATTTKVDKDGKEIEEAVVKTGEKPFWASFLEENGIEDPESAYTSVQG